MTSQSAQAAATLEGMKYAGPESFELLDQRVLPHTTKYDKIETVEDTHRAIKEMRVRGAPAIAVTAALGIAVEAKGKSFANDEEAKTFLLKSLDYIATSRPTAVNLFNAVRDLKSKVESFEGNVVAQYIAAAEALFQEDVSMNASLMKHGADFIFNRAQRPVRILTICNTGALATSRFGTALGVVRQLFYDGRLEQVYALETRPWNQGARLTVFECVTEKMPVTLIVDGAASFLMASKQIDAVVVGADRICKNGDTANKIGTYNLAVAAKHHNVPFFVAAPKTTLDVRTLHGADVVIEERETTEITHNMATMQRVVAEGDTLSIWNPVFDITPGTLITGGIITESGVTTPREGTTAYDFE